MKLASCVRTTRFYIGTTARMLLQRSRDYNWLRKELIGMGPVYVKLGQIASSRTDIIPSSIADALSGLQMDVPFEAFDVVRSVVESSFEGSRIEDLFSDFDTEPFAAASIAQVHRATVRDDYGNHHPVAVKVQRPGIRDSFVREVAILRSITDVLRLTGLREVEEMILVINDIERTISEETDFLTEMAHMRAFRKALRTESCVVIPRAIERLTRPHVLTMEYVPSRRITDYNSKELANYIMRTQVKLVVEHGYVHCDPHPGNLGVVDHTKVVIYDFGMIARIDPQKRDTLREACVLVFDRSAEELGELLVKNGIIVLRSDARSFVAASLQERRSLIRIFEYLFEYLDNLDTARLAMNLAIDPDIDVNHLPFRLDDSIFFLFRSMAVLEGVCKNIDSGFNYQYVIANMLFEFMDSDIIVRKAAQDISNLRNLQANVIAQMSKESDVAAVGSTPPSLSNREPPRLMDKYTILFMMLYTFLLSQ